MRIWMVAAARGHVSWSYGVSSNCLQEAENAEKVKRKRRWINMWPVVCARWRARLDWVFGWSYRGMPI